MVWVPVSGLGSWVERYVWCQELQWVWMLISVWSLLKTKLDVTVSSCSGLKVIGEGVSEGEAHGGDSCWRGKEVKATFHTLLGLSVDNRTHLWICMCTGMHCALCLSLTIMDLHSDQTGKGTRWGHWCSLCFYECLTCCPVYMYMGCICSSACVST